MMILRLQKAMALFKGFILIQLSLLFSKRVQRVLIRGRGGWICSWDWEGGWIGGRGGVWEKGRGRGKPAHGAWPAELSQGSSNVSSLFHRLFRHTDYRKQLSNVSKSESWRHR